MKNSREKICYRLSCVIDLQSSQLNANKEATKTNNKKCIEEETQRKWMDSRYYFGFLFKHLRVLQQKPSKLDSFSHFSVIIFFFYRLSQFWSYSSIIMFWTKTMTTEKRREGIQRKEWKEQLWTTWSTRKYPLEEEGGRKKLLDIKRGAFVLLYTFSSFLQSLEEQGSKIHTQQWCFIACLLRE